MSTARILLWSRSVSFEDKICLCFPEHSTSFSNIYTLRVALQRILLDRVLTLSVLDNQFPSSGTEGKSQLWNLGSPTATDGVSL